jgi:hypothetical protein
MFPASRERVTQMLLNGGHDDPGALGEPIPQVYGDLRSLARRNYWQEHLDHTFQSGVFVREAYLCLPRDKPLERQGLAHPFVVAAQLLRCVPADDARIRPAAKCDWATARACLKREMKQKVIRK